MRKFHSILFFLLALGLLQGCNYNYHKGTQLESEGRHEEANIEYHRAYTYSPDTPEFQEAYERTGKVTAKDLLERYKRYLNEKKYKLAFRRLEQARGLTPNDPFIQEEKKKWFRILLAGRVQFQFESLKGQVHLADKMILEIHFNTANPLRPLVGSIDPHNGIFAVEDLLYEPPQNLLMYYTVNSIGIKLESDLNPALRGSGANTRVYRKFINVRTPVLTAIDGTLDFKPNGLTSVQDSYPYELLKGSYNGNYWTPSGRQRYSIRLDKGAIHVKTKTPGIEFLPKILYLNKKDQRIFFDFGDLNVYQKKMGGVWSFRRNVTKQREYMNELQKNIILNPYFYHRDGGFPFVLSASDLQ